jgi:hypothetical protein
MPLEINEISIHWHFFEFLIIHNSRKKGHKDQENDERATN